MTAVDRERDSHAALVDTHSRSTTGGTNPPRSATVALDGVRVWVRNSHVRQRDALDGFGAVWVVDLEGVARVSTVSVNDLVGVDAAHVLVQRECA